MVGDAPSGEFVVSRMSSWNDSGEKSQRWHEIRLHGVRMRQFNGHLVHPIGNRNKGSIFPIKENETVVLQKGSVSFPVSQQAHVS